MGGGGGFYGKLVMVGFPPGKLGLCWGFLWKRGLVGFSPGKWGLWGFPHGKWWLWWGFLSGSGFSPLHNFSVHPRHCCGVSLWNRISWGYPQGSRGCSGFSLKGGAIAVCSRAMLPPDLFLMFVMMVSQGQCLCSEMAGPVSQACPLTAGPWRLAWCDHPTLPTSLKVGL